LAAATYPAFVSTPEGLADVAGRVADLRVGTPERDAAEEALEVHLAEHRLDSTEYDQRVGACREARSQADLRRIFADLPAPHPELPGPPGSVEEADDFPPLAQAVVTTLVLGLPVAIVIGFLHGAWWSLAVPVAVSVGMLYTEHLLNRRNEPS
jgi:hypothetical protein